MSKDKRPARCYLCDETGKMLHWGRALVLVCNQHGIPTPTEEELFEADRAERERQAAERLAFGHDDPRFWVNA